MVKFKKIILHSLLLGVFLSGGLSASFAQNQPLVNTDVKPILPAQNTQTTVTPDSAKEVDAVVGAMIAANQDTAQLDDEVVDDESGGADDLEDANSEPATSADDTQVLPKTGYNPADPYADLEKKKDELPYDELRRFAMVFSAIKNRYVEPIKDEKLVDGAIAGMLEQLDPHSSYLNKEDFDSLQEAAEGEFGGLGIETSESGDSLQIISPIEGSPAHKAGILPGDQIISVNGMSIANKPIGELIKQLRGDPGTEVSLVIKRGNKKKINFTLKRDVIKVQSVRSKLLTHNIAYVRISQFQERTIVDFIKQLKTFKNPPSKLVLDLRNNPGGLLNSAVGVAGAFIQKNDLVVYTKARDHVESRYKVRPSDYSLDGEDALKGLPTWARNIPIVVLINVGSASASEIVAGALQDYKRATIMGNRSFGKGSVQIVLPLDDDTGIKLTVARYYTPKNRSIQATGIMPDTIVSDTAKGDLFVFPREADLRDHLKNDTQSEEVGADKNAAENSSTLGDDAVFEFGSKQDFQLQQAVKYLLGEKVDQGKPNIKPKPKVTEIKKDTKEAKAKPAAK